MNFADGIVAELNKPLDMRRVSTRSVGGGRSADYLEAHDVIRTANTIFGYGNWGFDLVTEPHKIDEGVNVDREGKEHRWELWAATILLRVTTGENWHHSITEVGTTERNGEGPAGLDMAYKGCVSDALKRAFHHYGDQFGLTLYDKDRDRKPEAEREFIPPKSPAAAAYTPSPAFVVGAQLQTEMAVAGLTGVDLVAFLGCKPGRDNIIDAALRWLEDGHGDSIMGLVSAAVTKRDAAAEKVNP